MILFQGVLKIKLIKGVLRGRLEFFTIQRQLRTMEALKFYFEIIFQFVLLHSPIQIQCHRKSLSLW